MANHNDVVLLDTLYNRVAHVPLDYYVKGNYIFWSGYVHNDTANNITACKIVTTSEYDGVFAITGGTATNYSSITSSVDTTASIGSITAGEMKHVSIRIFISGGSALSGFQGASLYFTK